MIPGNPNLVQQQLKKQYTYNYIIITIYYYYYYDQKGIGCHYSLNVHRDEKQTKKKSHSKVTVHIIQTGGI